MLITSNKYFARNFDRTLPDGTVRHVTDVVHLKQKVSPTKFQATVVSSRKRNSDIIDISTLKGSEEISRHEFEELVRSLG